MDFHDSNMEDRVENVVRWKKEQNRVKVIKSSTHILEEEPSASPIEKPKSLQIQKSKASLHQRYKSEAVPSSQFDYTASNLIQKSNSPLDKS